MPNFNDPQGTWIRVQNQIPGGVVGALIILVIGWVIARLLQAGVTAALRQWWTAAIGARIMESIDDPIRRAYVHSQARRGRGQL